MVEATLPRVDYKEDTDNGTSSDKGEHHEEDDDDYDDDGDDKEDDRSTEAMTDDGNSLSSLASGEDYTAEELADAQNQLGGQNIALLAREQDDDDNQVLLMEVSDDEDGSVDMLDASSVDSFVEENEEKDEAEVEDITVLEKVFLDIDEGFTA